MKVKRLQEDEPVKREMLKQAPVPAPLTPNHLVTTKPRAVLLLL